MALKAMQLYAGLHIPDPQRLVARGRDHPLPIERSHGIDALVMALNATKLCSRFQVPQSQGVVILTAGDGARAGQSREMRDPTFVLRLESKQLFPGLDIPKRELAPPGAGENPAIIEHDEV